MRGSSSVEGYQSYFYQRNLVLVKMQRRVSHTCIMAPNLQYRMFPCRMYRNSGQDNILIDEVASHTCKSVTIKEN